jgi:hypothetical protein
LKLTGSIETFGEGSERRTAFVSGLAAILKIPEYQMVIVSVTAGSVIVELAFLRSDAAHASPSEVVLRLKAAAASGQLERFGLTGLTIGQENVLEKSSESLLVLIIASVGGAVAVIACAAVMCWRMRRSQVAFLLNSIHICAFFAAHHFH